MDGLGSTVTSSISVTIGIRANDEEKVGVAVVRNQESVNDPRHYVSI